MNKVLVFLNRLEEYTLGLTLLALALFSTVQVFTRYVFGISFAWFEELSRFSCVFITFLGAGLGFKYSTHFAMTAAVDKLPRKLKNVTTVAVFLISAFFFVVVAYYGLFQCQKHFKFGTLSAAMRWPMYIPYLPIPFFSAVMAWRCLMIVGRNIREMLQADPEAES
ncbi:MAG: TRAP transporter small permease [Pseudomonadota bacterium]